MIAIFIILGIIILFAVVVGCELSDARWVIERYVTGHNACADSNSERERTYRALLGANLVMGICVFLGCAALFTGIVIMLANL